MKRKDVNQIAFEVVQRAIGALPPRAAGKSAEAVRLGRKGGLKGGKARKKALSKDRLSEIARQAAVARWKSKRP